MPHGWRRTKKVFEAIELVGERLRPIWQSVDEPFPEVRKKGGDNISRGTIRRIQTLPRQGFKVKYIAEKLGVSQQTVIRRSRQSNGGGQGSG
jgi:hypothetical protein